MKEVKKRLSILKNWKKLQRSNGQVYYIGEAYNHPKYTNGELIRTSPVILEKESFIKTENREYKLMGESCV